MKQQANEIDNIIGANLRAYRLMRGLTQQALGEAIGKSAQQIQKYENATNHLSVSTLLDISKVLNLPLVLFWSELRLSQPRPGRFSDTKAAGR